MLLNGGSYMPTSSFPCNKRHFIGTVSMFPRKTYLRMGVVTCLHHHIFQMISKSETKAVLITNNISSVQQ
jgi:hypothetical protein